jgi:hypothetical protein
LHYYYHGHKTTEVLRFIPGQSRLNRSSTSLASRAVTIYDDSDESSPLLASGLIPTRRQVSQWTNSIWKRQAVLLVLPVSIVSTLPSASHYAEQQNHPFFLLQRQLSVIALSPSSSPPYHFEPLGALSVRKGI